MKNILIGVLAFMTLVGCEKQQLESTEATSGSLQDLKTRVKVTNDRLVFENEASYQAAIDYLVKLENEGRDYKKNWDNELGFNSLNQQKTDIELEKMEIDDPVFAELLNKDQQLQVGSKIFTIDAINKRLIVEDALSGEKEQFSTNDDYFGIMDGSVLVGARGGCSSTDSKHTDPSNSSVRSKMVYRKLGIYHYLRANIQGPGGSTYITLSSGGGNWYKKNKKKASNQTIGTHYDAGTSSGYNYRAYRNTRGLKGYYFRVLFSGTTSWYHHISC